MTRDTDVDVLAAWAEGGAMALTGREGERPLGPPAPLVAGLVRIGAELERHAARRGVDLTFDPVRALCIRAAFSELDRRGDVSCGGATRLLRAGDGWIAVCLARDDDIAMIPAWLEIDAVPSDHWSAVEIVMRHRSVADVVRRASLVGMPVAALGEVWSQSNRDCGVRTTVVTPRGPRKVRDRPLVVDLSSLWAGPLCGQVLGQLGARVIKVESHSRPDAARQVTTGFFEFLNAGKESVVLDFDAPSDIEWLQRLLRLADVVIEGSRPRALEQLGIYAQDVVSEGASVWLSITGYGRDPGLRDRVAFGDDAAVAGGLVVWDERGPCFCADAVADPLTGMAAAAAVLDALERTDREHGLIVDVAMSAVAAAFAGPTVIVPADVEARPPRVPTVVAGGSKLGEHSEAIRVELSGRA
jgi:hypothetical protein